MLKLAVRCAHICICVYVYVYVHGYASEVYAYVFVCICMYTCMSMCMCVYPKMEVQDVRVFGHLMNVTYLQGKRAATNILDIGHARFPLNVPT